MTKQEYLRDVALRIPLYFYRRPRELTLEQARDLALYFWAAQQFAVSSQTEMLRERDGTIVPLDPKQRIAIDPPIICGVRYLYINTWKPGTYGRTLAVGVSAANPLNNLDLRMVVFLCWFSFVMRTTYGAKTCYHLGIGGGKGPSSDCHNQGRAFDFAGLAGGEGSGAYDLLVGREWFGQPVALRADWEGRKAGTKLPQWPKGGYTKTVYRLEPATNPFLDPAMNPEVARQVFQAVYELGTWGCEDRRGGNPPPPTTIGERSGMILHPDYGQSNSPATADHREGSDGREAHWQHIHMQIGPTHG